MFLSKIRHLLLMLFCVSIFMLSAACDTSTNLTQTNNTSSSPTANRSSVTSISVTNPTKVTSNAAANQATTTDCPTSGSGRVAVIPSLQLGKHRTIVFFSNDSSNTKDLALKRYDVETGIVTTIRSQQGQRIYNAQISRDGQWILFVAQTSSASKIQLIRMDGMYLQTLYCAPNGQQIDPLNGAEGGYSHGVQWSPDQKQVIFTQGKQATLVPAPDLYLLNIQNGGIQVEFIPTKEELYRQPQTWVDNTRIYITSQGVTFPAPPATLSILDTSKGEKQHASDLQIVLGVGDTLWDADSTYDASQLFVVLFDPTVGRAGPGTFCQITSMSTTGENGKLIFNSTQLVVSSLRVLGYDSKNLLLSVNQQSTPANQDNGIWKIKTDGTGLTRLTNQPGAFNSFSQYPWSNVSRDGSLYVINTFFGSTNGGAITHYTSDNTALPVGWTTF